MSLGGWVCRGSGQFAQTGGLQNASRPVWPALFSSWDWRVRWSKNHRFEFSQLSSSMVVQPPWIMRALCTALLIIWAAMHRSLGPNPMLSWCSPVAPKRTPLYPAAAPVTVPLLSQAWSILQPAHPPPDQLCPFLSSSHPENVFLPLSMFVTGSTQTNSAAQAQDWAARLVADYVLHSSSSGHYFHWT